MFWAGLCPIRTHYVRQLHINRTDKRRGNTVVSVVHRYMHISLQDKITIGLEEVF